MKTSILKTICILLGSLLCCPMLHAQSRQIEDLEQKIKTSNGAEAAEWMLQLSNAYLSAGNPAKAEDWAGKAAGKAKDVGATELQASALNQEGKVMQLRGKKKSAAKYQQSLDLLRKYKSTNNTLAIDNLERLQALAQQGNKEKELALIQLQLSVLKRGGSLSDPLPNNEKAFQQELTAMQKQLEANQSTYQAEQNKLLAESKTLQDELAAREAVIDKMTQEQMKTAMMVMQQKALIDSVTYRARVDSLSVSNAHLALKEAESNRNFNYAIMGVLLLLAGGSTYSFLKARENAKIMAEKNKVIREEQIRSENLLLNILPALVADELKQKGRTQARYFEDVSVLFADFVGFSTIAEKLSPQQLVSELDTCFQKFDEIIAKHDLEKIKTIGDAYMCAGGVPEGGDAKILNMVAAAIDMQSWLAAWNIDRDKKGLPRFDARIGIHRGPVVAGVVGSRKFAFDIWGDTVNVAARIEQAGEGGRINISGEAYAALKDVYTCQHRGKIPAKNKGEIDMYFVEN